MSKLAIETIELTPDDAQVELADNRPFFIKGCTSQPSTGFLLVHGFTGTPWEMRDIGLHLAEQGNDVLGVRLPGHGTSAEDLAGRKYEEWLAAVEEGYRHLARNHQQIIGVGLSTGSLLLIAAARKHSFAGLILLSPYLKMRQLLAPFAGLLKYFIRYNRRPIDIGVSPYYYQDRPIAGAHQINRLIRKAKKQLPHIDCPTLVASAAGDITVDSRSAVTLFNRLKCKRKEYYRFGKAVPHVLTTADNPKQDELLQISAKFAGTLNAQ